MSTASLSVDLNRTYIAKEGHVFEARVDENGSGIELVFPSYNGRTTSYFQAPWLWSNNPSFVHPTSGQRLKTPGRYPGTKISSVKFLTNDDDLDSLGATLPVPPPPKGCLHPVGTVFKQAKNERIQSELLLRVEWEPENGDPQTSVSFYSVDWLRQWRYDDAALQRRRCLSEVTHDHCIRRITNGQDGIVHVDFNQLITEGCDDARFETLRAIFRDGAAIIKHAPVVSSNIGSSVERVGRSLGVSLSHGSLYGDVFHVQSSPDAHNLAYTSIPLQPHQDLAYYESMPGLQLLHCVENYGVEGGESVLVDAMAAAYYFRQIAPHYFETLTTCPATFVKQREGADMVYRRPHIVVDAGSTMVPKDAEIVSVSWSPPFEGPTCLSAHLVEAYYEAYAAFELMLDNSLPRNDETDILHSALSVMLRDYADQYTWERQLEPGEILVFNNRRMLHGRRGFSINSGAGRGRHLVGAYTNIDDTLNEYRRLRRKRSDFLETRNAGNGSTAGL